MAEQDPDKGVQGVPTNGSGGSPAPSAPRAGLGSAGVSAERILASAPAEQIEAAFAQKKVDRAAELLEAHGERLLAEGEEEHLLGWFAALPEALIKKKPRLAVVHAWLYVYTERYHHALARLAEAERELRRLEMAGQTSHQDADVVELTPHAELKRSIAAVRAHLSWMAGDLSSLPESVDEVMLASSGDHPVWRARALVTLGRCRALAGALSDAADDVDAALACAMVAGQARARVVELEAIVTMGQIREAQGQLAQADALFEQAIENAGDHPERREHKALALLGLGRTALLRLDMATAKRFLEAGLSAMGDEPSASVGLDGYLSSATLRQWTGDPQGATEALNRGERFLKEKAVRWAAEFLSVHRARLAIARRDQGAAKRWAQQFALRGADRLGPLRELQLVTYGGALLLEGEVEAAIAALEEARASATAGGRKILAIEAAIKLASAYTRAGRKKDAKEALDAALGVAAATGIALPLCEAEGIGALFAAAGQPKQPGLEAIMKAVIAVVGEPAAPPSAAAPAPTKPVVVAKAPIGTKQPVPAPEAKGEAAAAPEESATAAAPTSGEEAHAEGIGDAPAATEEASPAKGEPKPAEAAPTEG